MNQLVQNKALVTQLFKAGVEGRNINVFDDVCATSFVDHNFDVANQKGTLENVKTMFRGIYEAFPNMNVQVDSLVAENDRVGIHVTMSGTHLGTFNGIAATGRPVTITGFDWFRVQNGKITERWGSFDMVGLMTQLGVVPGPTTNDLKAVSKKYYEALDATRGDLASITKEIAHPQLTAVFSNKTLDTVALQGFLKNFYAAFPDLTHVVEEQIAEGNTVYNRMTLKGTHKGDFGAVKATNKSIAVTCMTSHHYVDGKLYTQTGEADLAGLLQQIGALPKH